MARTEGFLAGLRSDTRLRQAAQNARLTAKRVSAARSCTVKTAQNYTKETQPYVIGAYRCADFNQRCAGWHGNLRKS